MVSNNELQRYTLLASYFIPDGILDWFDLVRMKETDNDKPTHEQDVLYPKILHIYLDERDNRQGEDLSLVPNGFTEPSVIHDYPARSRKVVLHVRRYRYLDAAGRNIILYSYPLAAEGTRLSVEFGAFLKTVLDNLPVTCSSVARFFHIKGSTLERNYKKFLSDFRDLGPEGPCRRLGASGEESGRIRLH